MVTFAEIGKKIDDGPAPTIRQSTSKSLPYQFDLYQLVSSTTGEAGLKQARPLLSRWLQGV